MSACAQEQEVFVRVRSIAERDNLLIESVPNWPLLLHGFFLFTGKQWAGFSKEENKMPQFTRSRQRKAFTYQT